MPVTELGLVAAAGTLGLTGHWVGHGCGGGGQGSAGSLAAPSGSPHPFRPSVCRAVRAGPPGRPLRGHHCAPLPFCHIRASTPRSVLLPLPPAHLVELGMGGSRMSGQECVTWAGLRRAAASSTSGLRALGSRISGGLWGASRRRLSSKPGCPGKGSGQVPGAGRVAGPSSDPTFAFHVVVHLKLHLVGPCGGRDGDGKGGSGDGGGVCPRDTGYRGGGEDKGQGHWGLGSQGEGCWGERGQVSLPPGETWHRGVWCVGARNSPISIQLPDRPQRTLLIPEAELERPRDRDRQSQRQREKDIRARCL